MKVENQENKNLGIKKYWENTQIIKNICYAEQEKHP